MTPVGKMKCPGSGRLEKERKKETTEADEGPEVLKERRQRELAGRGGAGGLDENHSCRRLSALLSDGQEGSSVLRPHFPGRLTFRGG